MRVTEKGQVTIPKSIRDKLGIGPGSEVEFLDNNGEVHLIRMEGSARKENDVLEWLRMARGSGTGRLTTDEIMETTRGPFDDVDPR